VLAICGSLVEMRDRRLLVAFCLTSALFIGVGILCLSPGIEIYGGLSGLATGSMALLALQGVKFRSPIFSWLVLGCIAGKICYEIGTGRMLFVQSAAPGLAVLPLAHLIGVLSAVMIRSLNFDLV